MEEVYDRAKALEQEICAWRRAIHGFAEVGACLPRTREFVMQTLREMGYTPRETAGGVTVLLEGPSGGKTILLRADMDALPVEEKTGLPFRAENGNMHACGHDLHAAMLLGAAQVLMDNKDKLAGAVKLVFQPDEEGFTGAKAMLAAGVLDEPKVDAALALHVHSGTPTGQVLCGSGTCMAGCRLFRITVRGVSCHGAMPETGVDPINIASHIVLALQTLSARETAAVEPSVVTIGKFAAGDAPNLIPGQAVLEGSIRALDKALGERLWKRVEEIGAQTAAAFGGTAQAEELASAPPLRNDPALVKEMTAYAARILPGTPFVYPDGGMGSEDFSSYTQLVPSAYLLLGAGSVQENAAYGRPMHNEAVIFNEQVLPMGAALYAGCAMRWLAEHA